MAELLIKVEGSWINYWFMRVFAKPAVIMNGDVFDLEWGKFNTLEISPGAHVIGVGVSYGRRNFMGSLNPMEEVKLSFREGQSRKFIAQNGIMNHSPFLLYEVD